MAYKLIDAAQTRWRAFNARHLVALVRAGAVFNSAALLDDQDSFFCQINRHYRRTTTVFNASEMRFLACDERRTVRGVLE